MSTELNNEASVENHNSDDDDLDLFSQNLYGKEPVKEDVEDSPAEDANLETEADDDLAPVEDEDTEDKEDTPAPKKKNSFQERIDELTKERRHEERLRKEEQEKREALERRLEELEKKTNPEPQVTKPKVDDGPRPDDVNEDGTAKYDLGEFDPLYIRDITRHTMKVEQEEYRAQVAREQAETKAREAAQAAQDAWKAKLEPAQERYPDFTEKGEALLEAFSGLDENYGDYLASTIMDMDFGPDVLYYLSNNPDEAKRIVNLGATRATLALGRIESKFALAEDEKQKARPIVSNAPVPPPTNKGSAVSAPVVEDDTDDLDAFEKKLYRK